MVVSAALVFTVSEAKAEIMCLRTKGCRNPPSYAA